MPFFWSVHSVRMPCTPSDIEALQCGIVELCAGEWLSVYRGTFDTRLSELRGYSVVSVWL